MSHSFKTLGKILKARESLDSSLYALGKYIEAILKKHKAAKDAPHAYYDPFRCFHWDTHYKEMCIDNKDGVECLQINFEHWYSGWSDVERFWIPLEIIQLGEAAINEWARQTAEKALKEFKDKKAKAEQERQEADLKKYLELKKQFESN